MPHGTQASAQRIQRQVDQQTEDPNATACCCATIGLGATIIALYIGIRLVVNNDILPDTSKKTTAAIGSIALVGGACMGAISCYLCRVLCCKAGFRWREDRTVIINARDLNEILTHNGTSGLPVLEAPLVLPANTPTVVGLVVSDTPDQASPPSLQNTQQADPASSEAPPPSSSTPMLLSAQDADTPSAAKHQAPD